MAAGGGCGGNVWAPAAAATSTKAIDTIDIRIMIPLCGHPARPLWKNLSHILPALSRVAAFSKLLCHNRLPLCGAAATSFADALAPRPDAGIHLGRRACQQELVSKGLSVRACQ